MERERLNEVLVSTFVAVEALHGFSAVLPSIFTIRHFGCEAGAVRAIRDGELVGTAISLGLGAVVGAMIRSPLPVLFALGASAIMVSVYEYALRTRSCGGQAPVSLVEVDGVYMPAWQASLAANSAMPIVGVSNA